MLTNHIVFDSPLSKLMGNGRDHSGLKGYGMNKVNAGHHTRSITAFCPAMTGAGVA